jgi:uncharacterized protein YcnI
LKRITALGAALLAALVVAAAAMAHAKVSPPIVQKGTDNVFTVAVPTESETAATTAVELNVPEGFGIDAVMPAPGWHIATQKTGSGENADITKITWTGGSVPSEQATDFEFVGGADSAKSYTFSVRQTYSDGKVVDWSGPESSDTPAQVVEAKSDLGGGGTSTMTWIALILGAVAVVLALVALMGRAGGGGGGGEKRELA